MSDPKQDPEYVLRGVVGRVFGRSYHLLAPTTLGRAPECDICLADHGISRMHARLRPLDYGVEVEDLRSTNGSFLNGQRVTVGVARVGDEIAFDQLRFRVERAVHSRAGSEGIRTAKSTRARWPWLLLAALVAAAGVAALLLR
ncbi:FHA domain-containing protein [Lysobacter yangpyeongensis]|uniref:FHA domain-containing protein n=1 Tax=Lysobacter yangpyeongensis TaxID=346182 RepID=A0ABW0SPW9_9GAMM